MFLQHCLVELLYSTVSIRTLRVNYLVAKVQQIAILMVSCPDHHVSHKLSQRACVQNIET